MPMSSCSRTWCASWPCINHRWGRSADAERLIAASQAEIERTRRQTRTELEEIGREVDEARRELPHGHRSIPTSSAVSRPASPARVGKLYSLPPRIGCSGMPRLTSPVASSNFWLTRWMPG